MANIARIRVLWAGVVGGGVSTFHSNESDVATAYTAVHDFFDGIKGLVPYGLVQWTFPNTGDVIDMATNSLVGAWSATQEPPVDSSSPTNDRAGSVGARVQWNTSAVIGGRRPRGATFLTELAVSSYSPDGTLTPTALGTIGAAAASLVGAGVLGVYSRPGPQGSGFSIITGYSVPDRVTALRSRRF